MRKQHQPEVTAAEESALETQTRTAPVRSFYRIAWRRMVAITGVRTLYPALIPPGPAHVNTVYSAASERRQMTLAAACMSSLICDFYIRARDSELQFEAVDNMPRVPDNHPAAPHLIERALRLNCLTGAYARLWREVMGTDWTREVAYRTAASRRYALIEIDALVALALGITLDELLTIYHTAFPVLRLRYEQKQVYDADGRLVPEAVLKADPAAVAALHLGQALAEGVDGHTYTGNLSEEQRTWVHPESGRAYTASYPFTRPSREADTTAAYRHFAALLFPPSSG